MTFRKPHISMLARGDGGVVSQSCSALCSPARLLCPWDSPGKNTGVGCHSCLQGIFPTQGSNPVS